MKVLDRTEQYAKIREQLKCCPSCGKGLVPGAAGSMLLRCPDLFHGAFAIVWHFEDERYYVTYIPKQRSLQ